MKDSYQKCDEAKIKQAFINETVVTFDRKEFDEHVLE